MGGEWISTTLGEVLTLQRGFDLPETDRTPGPYPVIASTGPVGTHNHAIVHGPGVVIGRSGSLSVAANSSRVTFGPSIQPCGSRILRETTGASATTS